MNQTSGPKGKIAWSLAPVLSGMTTFYRVVGAALRRSGWQVTGFVSGAADRLEMDNRFADDHCEMLVPGDSDVCRNAREFVRRVVEKKYDVVYCTGHLFSIAGAPALPPQVRLVTHCVVNTRYGYALAAANVDRTNAVVVETPRQRQDMVRDWKVDAKKCILIPGGIEIQDFSPGAVRDPEGTLRLAYVGRLDNAHKAVLMLPRIASQLEAAGIAFHFDVLGDGPDRKRLEDGFAQAQLNGRITIHGTLGREDALPILQQAHLFVLPSRYEGIPWALLETMACGCVPVVSRLAGTTDHVVNHGTNGLLCTVGKTSEFSKAILELARDRKRLQTLSAAAVRTVRDRFTVERVVKDHDRLLQSLLAQEPIPYAPILLSEIRAPQLSGPTWHRYVPQGVKDYVRTWAERFQWSI